MQWVDAKPHLHSVRLGGIEQFINHFKRCQGIEMPLFLWGDEIECGVFQRNDHGHYDLSQTAALRDQLKELEATHADLPIGCEWQPEYGSWMIESVPRNPYGSYISDLLNVEKSMMLRRKRLHYALPMGQIAPTVTTFPMLGVAGYAHTLPQGPIAGSSLVADTVIGQHPRFAALTANIRCRRGRQANITIPSASAQAQTQSIEMDAMAFGMGCCCLQITMQCNNQQESRFLHDQLAILAPIFQALSASSPVFHGQLAGTDSRWEVISAAVDDRTPAEAGIGPGQPDEHMAGQGVRRIQKSRYSSVSLFLHEGKDDEERDRLSALNDLAVEMDEQVLAMTEAAGMDSALCKHLAHLFIRDPLVIFDDAIALDNSQSLVSPSPTPHPHRLIPFLQDHFENIQSTNWRSMRWKPPSLNVGLTRASHPADSMEQQDYEDMDHNILMEDRQQFSPTSPDLQAHGPGWRVEFRPLEVQLTDHENAAYAILTVLTARYLLAKAQEIYLPMSLVEENMRRAQGKDAVLTQRFFFRRDAFRTQGTSQFRVPAREEMEIAELSVDEIINGEVSGVFPGLLAVLRGYIASLGCDAEHLHQELSSYLSLLSDRAAGRLPTAARYMRSFIEQHPAYNGNGTLTPAIADNLLDHCEDIGMGRLAAPALYGVHHTVRIIDQIDEEDLMFANFTCFVRPVALLTPITLPEESKEPVKPKRRRKVPREGNIRF